MREGLVPEVVRHTDDEGVLLNGAAGEGGGQILRSALALSSLTGRSVEVEDIRAGRSRPGLLRQHLTAARAAASISNGTLTGDALGSRRLRLQPGTVRGGHFEFAVGTAGSSSLVFQTVLPALLRAPEPSTLVLEGGTHNPLAPPFEFLRDAFMPRVEEFGPRVALTLERSGFYPAGGGRWRAEIAPSIDWHPQHWLKRGDRHGQALRAVVAGLSPSIAERECKVLLRALRWRETDAEVHELPAHEGPGNVTLVTMRYQHVTEVVSSFGERGVTAERVARAAAKEARRYLGTNAAVGEHLADQLLLPMAMAGGGSMSTLSPSRHTLTNMAVIEAFLAVRFTLEKLDRDHFLIAVAPTEE